MKILSLFVVVLLLAGCSKKGSVLPKPTAPVKVTLLSKATYTYPGVTRVDVYTYDDKNRLIELKATHLSFDYKYTYDDQNNLLSETDYYLTGALSRSANFSYSGNTVTVTEYDDSGTLRNTLHWTLNAQKLVATSEDQGAITQYSYDSDGNLTSWIGTGMTVPYTYTFDNKKHPLSMLGGKNYHLMEMGGDDFSSFVNNILTSTFRDQTNTYTYNADGFPLTANMIAGANTYTVNFEYIVK